MPADRIDYSKIFLESARHAIRNILIRLSHLGKENIGNHAIYILLRTDMPETKIPKYLKTKYPERLYIALQHQFYDLNVKNDTISVNLSFGGVLQNISFTLSSILSLSDEPANIKINLEEMMDSSQITPKNHTSQGNVITVDFKKRC